jgi:hypothetical protein
VARPSCPRQELSCTTRPPLTPPLRSASCASAAALPEAAEATLAVAFEHYELHRVFGRLEARNTASARVLEKIGMRREGLLVENEWVKGEWQSELIYALRDREWRAR